MDLDKFERFISNSFRNVGQGFYDSYVEANVRFRSKLGMKEVIVRRQLGNCCKWCADLAGIYDANNHPDDIYKRHRNCRCLVTHKTEKGYKDNLVSKTQYFKTQKEVRYERIKQLENTDRILKEDNLKARRSKKISDFLVDLEKNAEFVKNEIPGKIKKETLIPILREKGFLEEYHISKIPKIIGGGNAYLSISDLAYIFKRHSKEIPLEHYSKLSEVIRDYDVLYRDKRYNNSFMFYKTYETNGGKYGLELAIARRPKTNTEYIVHFVYIGLSGESSKKRYEKIKNKQQIIDVKKDYDKI